MRVSTVSLVVALIAFFSTFLMGPTDNMVQATNAHGISASVPAGTMSACEVEWQMSACVWDASEADESKNKNDQGKSFVVLGENETAEVFYISHAEAKELLGQ